MKSIEKAIIYPFTRQMRTNQISVDLIVYGRSARMVLPSFTRASQAKQYVDDIYKNDNVIVSKSFLRYIYIQTDIMMDDQSPSILSAATLFTDIINNIDPYSENATHSLIIVMPSRKFYT